MPIVRFAGRDFSCDAGANLRRLLLDGGAALYAPPMNVFHCRGLGTCGTCALEIRAADGGEVPPLSPITKMERWRLGFPPHHHTNAPVDPSAQLRLACQVQVQGDVRCVRRSGLWGQGAPSMER